MAAPMALLNCTGSQVAPSKRGCQLHPQPSLRLKALSTKPCLLELKSSKRSACKFVFQTRASSTAVEAPAASASVQDDEELPLLLRALRGDEVERPPVWMMRQAGRVMQVYRDLCVDHPTFRERSENTDLVVEISLQPWRAFKGDGIILFSDILTPLHGMNIPFDIVTGKGPIIFDPIRTLEQVEAVTELRPDECVPYVGEALRRLRKEAGNKATVLGFVGAPFTLASYIVEGGSTKTFSEIKKLLHEKPDVLHALLKKLGDGVADYIRYQAAAGAQAVQIFDSWAAQITPEEFDVFAGPYIKAIIDSVKATNPDLPIILYISGSAQLLERMAACGPDVISVDGSVDIAEAIQRVGPNFAIQGNVAPEVLLEDKATIEKVVLETIRKAKGTRHIMNLGHGVMPITPEENVEYFFEVCRTAHLR